MLFIDRVKLVVMFMLTIIIHSSINKENIYIDNLRLQIIKYLTSKSTPYQYWYDKAIDMIYKNLSTKYIMIHLMSVFWYLILFLVTKLRFCHLSNRYCNVWKYKLPVSCLESWLKVSILFILFSWKFWLPCYDYFKMAEQDKIIVTINRPISDYICPTLIWPRLLQWKMGLIRGVSLLNKTIY